MNDTTMNDANTTPAVAPAAVAPDAYLCSITQALMVDPVQDSEGNTYERAAIELWLESHDTSPITRRRLRVNQLTPNRALRNAIDDWCRANGVALPAVNAVNAAVNAGGVAPVSRECHVGTEPVNVALVLDTSGSMGCEALSLSEDGGGEVGQRLARVDLASVFLRGMCAFWKEHPDLPVNVSVSVFNTHFTNFFSRKPMTPANCALLEERLDSGHLSPDGQTNLLGALIQTYTEAVSGWPSDARNYVVVFTDGAPYPPGPRGTLRRFREWLHTTYRDRPTERVALPALRIVGLGMGEIDLDTMLDLVRVVDDLRESRGLPPNGGFVFVSDSTVIGDVICCMTAALSMPRPPAAVEEAQRRRYALLRDPCFTGRFPLGRYIQCLEDVLRATRCELRESRFGPDRRAPFTEGMLEVASQLVANYKAADGGDPWEDECDVALESIRHCEMWGRAYIAGCLSMARSGEPSMTYLAPATNALVRDWQPTRVGVDGEHGFLHRQSGERVTPSLPRALLSPTLVECATLLGLPVRTFDAMLERVHSVFDAIPMPTKSIVRHLNRRQTPAGGPMRHATVPPRMHTSAAVNDDAADHDGINVPSFAVHRAMTAGDYFNTASQGGVCFSGNIIRLTPDGERVYVHSTQLRKGDVVVVDPSYRVATVRNVFLTPMDRAPSHPICANGRMFITPYHPMWDDAKMRWVPACNHSDSTWTTTAHMLEKTDPGRHVASVLLEPDATGRVASHVLVLTHEERDMPYTPVATLGHGSDEYGLRHAFFGNAALMDRLAEAVGEDEEEDERGWGRIHLDPSRVEIVREGGRGDVVAMRVRQTDGTVVTVSSEEDE